MATVGLLYVGAILFINGMSLMGFISGKGSAPLNFFVGILQVLTPTFLIFTADGDPAVIAGAAGLYLFGFTYLWVGLNNVCGWENSGLGWFSLFVAAVAIGFGVHDIVTTGNMTSAVSWFLWAVLWFLFFVMMALDKKIAPIVGFVAAVEGIITGAIPAMFALTGNGLGDTPKAIGLAVLGVLMLVLAVPLAKKLERVPAAG